MSISHTFLVPDYYPGFRCKGGACRATCCRGWGISVTLEEYFHLLGMDCPQEVRGKLDCAFHIPKDSSPERYALINPNWQGDCPLHAPDGLCLLQCACGEAVLPSICRIYPRSPKQEFAWECSCTNSCEAVLEQLIGRTAPLTFETQMLTFDLPSLPEKQLRKPRGFYTAIRSLCLHLMQNRALPLQRRLLSIGMALDAVAGVMDAEEESIRAVVEALDAHPPVAESFPADDTAALTIVRGMLDVFLETSESLSDYAQSVLAVTGDRFALARQTFERTFPQWETDFENILVNHCFYECFPFSDHETSLRDEFLSLCAVYALLRVLSISIAGTVKAPTKDAYVDAAAAAFRLIEHSRFDRNAAVLLHRKGCVSNAQLARLLSL